ncbi:MAG: MurR/RpiR family transcriptional regulator [Acidimicrobiia bacterium]|nr:MurR/RpiR family transcriptional regulator [Acidimicrobiia bacterium]MDH4308942.1 MurR/RpiR family transcriptional regulator [Acidimicrobiia bacterium]MDH5292961.1 MurR/RpiR family transcriptional regulator [Acidimicrobiia bacterium]MDH5522225.1 MurR/RpiR family transcriptional regulator [Acidimicrobiia bacterium]
MTVADKVHQSIDTMTRAERMAATALLATYPLLGLRTVAEFAAEAGVSSPTVLRFVDRLGFANYPSFQQELHVELADQLKSPLDKAGSPQARPLTELSRTIVGNIESTMASIPERELEEVIESLGDPRHPVFTTGGRFTDALARHLASHLQLMRPNVRHIERDADSRRDQLIDVPRDSRIVCFDIRRYDPSLTAFAARAAQRGAQIVLFTDQWISPAAHSARHVFPGRVEVPSIWDSLTSLMVLVDTVLAGVARTRWDETTARLSDLEELRRAVDPDAP